VDGSEEAVTAAQAKLRCQCGGVPYTALANDDGKDVDVQIIERVACPEDVAHYTRDPRAGVDPAREASIDVDDRPPVRQTPGFAEKTEWFTGKLHDAGIRIGWMRLLPKRSVESATIK
jgi:hypothetical protein